MASKQQPEYESGLETAPQNFPEVTQGGYHDEAHYPQVAQQAQGYQYPQQHPQPLYPQQQYQSYQNAAALPKPDEPYASPGEAGSPFSPNTQAATLVNENKPGKKILGCPVLIFILSLIIGILSAALIGLAAATGIESARASDNANRAASLSSALAEATPTGTSTGLTPVATDFNTLSNGCTENPNGVSRTDYIAYSLSGAATFTQYCNRDAPGTPLMGLFAADFETCMDACSAYSKYVPEHFDESENTTCEAVSFIPLWTDKTTALDGGAPGNCFLKPGPVGSDDLTIPNIGTECHAALLVKP